jgi:hypothetical protein
MRHAASQVVIQARGSVTPGEFAGRGLVEFPDDVVW